MRLVTFGDAARIGLIQGDQLLDIMEASRIDGMELGFHSLLELIEAGRQGLDQARSIAERARNLDAPSLRHVLAASSLRAPWPGQRLVLVGANSAKHIADVFTNMGTPVSEQEIFENSRKNPPTAFWGAARPVMGPGARIEMPERAKGFFDYEGEVGVVIGKRGKDIRAEDARDYIWGITLVNDWSIREEIWPPRPTEPFMLIKNFDCSKSIGPAISVGEDAPEDVEVETLVNGELRQRYAMRDMIFSFGEVLEYLSRDFTFYPGDVISLGTGAGTAVDTTVPNEDGSWPKDRFLKPGDIVEVRSRSIGSLIGHIAAKSA